MIVNQPSQPQPPSSEAPGETTTTAAAAENLLRQLAGVFRWTPIGEQSALEISSAVAGSIESGSLDLEARYRTLVEQLPAVVFMAYLNEGTGEAYVSPHIEALLGFTQEEWLNDPVRWFQQIHPDDKERWSYEAASIFLSDEPLRSAYRVLTRDGRVVWFHCEAKLVHHDDGTPWFIHGVAIDVTELKEAEAELRRAHDELEQRVMERTAELAATNRELQLEIAERRRVEEERAALLKREKTAREAAEAANRLKDEFLATVSHELRTPLTAVLGWACMLRMGKFGGDTFDKALEAIERNARSQSQLIDDLLDVSRIIAGKVRLKVQQVNLNAVIEAALDAVQPAADAKGIKIKRIMPSLPGEVSGDPDRLQQIVWNILSNAVKFTPRYGAMIIRCTPGDEEVEIAVEDSGPGISLDFLPHVFDRFRQADGSYTRTHGGLGLGLAIARHLVELHGGTIKAMNNDRGSGAIFTVRLPLLGRQDLEAAPVPLAEPQKISTTQLLLTGLKILVVDDDPDALELLTLVFTQYGATVTAASSAKDALAAYQQNGIDVVVSDIQMPDVDGYQLLRQVRAIADERASRLTALAVTAHAKADDRSRALQAGYHAHVSKPVDPTELVLMLSSLVHREE
jgi:PAS domain S-box-containing protein